MLNSRPVSNLASSLLGKEKASEAMVDFVLDMQPFSGSLSPSPSDFTNRTMKRKFWLPPFHHIRESITPVTKSTMMSVSCFGRWMFTWVSPIFDRAEKRELTNRDLYEVGKPLQSFSNDDAFENLKEQLLKKGQQLDDLELTRRLVSYNYRKGICYYLLSNALELSIPLLITDYYRRKLPEPEPWTVWGYPLLYIGLILLVLFLRFVFWNQGAFFIRACGARTSAVLRTRLFRKLFYMPQAVTEKYPGSKVLSMMTIDLENLASGLSILPDFVNSVFLFTFSFAYLWYDVKDPEVVAVVAGLVLCAVIIFRLIHLQTKKFRMAVLEVNDEKAKIIKKLLADIEFVKTNQLEKLFYEQVVGQYQVQNELAKSHMIWDQSANMITFFMPILFAFVIFGYREWKQRSGEVEENSSYLVLTVLSIMRNPIFSISDAFRRYPNYQASLKRLSQFLAEKEKEDLKLEAFSQAEVPVGGIGSIG